VGESTPLSTWNFPNYRTTHWAGLVDFDLATRDASKPDRLRADYNLNDHLHPNDAGYKAMADAVDLTIFTK
jgi:lysophospholipase L1-like esterase